MVRTLAAERRTERIRVFYRKQVSLLPLLGLVPSFLLATYSLMKPWAVGRALILFKISKSPGAALLLAVTLAGMVGASVAVATRGRDRGPAAAVHLVTGILMALVAVLAFRMVREAPTRLLGFVPVASIHPGPGLRLFLVASAMVVALGLLELGLGIVERRKKVVVAHARVSDHNPQESPTS
jgi:hypothetical protein